MPYIKITRVDICTQVRQAVEARGMTFTTTCEAGGPIRYVINGEAMSPGEAADRYLPGGFAGNFGTTGRR